MQESGVRFGFIHYISLPFLVPSLFVFVLNQNPFHYVPVRVKLLDLLCVVRALIVSEQFQ